VSSVLFDEALFEPPSFVSSPDPTSGGRRTMVRGSAWYVGSVAVGAALSLGFLLVAARLVDQDALGAANGLWAQLQLVNYLTAMGLPVAMARYGSGRARTVHVLFLWALLYTAVTSVIGTVIYGAVAPHVIAKAYLAPLQQWGLGGGLAVFCLLTMGISFALLVEVRLVTLRRWHWVFARVALLSLARFPFLALPVLHTEAFGLFLLMAGLPALSGFLGVAALYAATPRRERAPLLPLPSEARPALAFASVNYVSMLAAQAPQFALPVVVTGYVPAAQYAPFYLAWQVTMMAFLVPHTIGQVVLTEGSRSRGAAGQQVRLGLALSMGAMVVALGAVLVVVKLGIIPKVLGPDFALTATLLPRFVAAGIPWAVTSVCLAKARVEGNHARTVAITVGFALATLLPAVAMTRMAGVNGTAWAWLLGNAVAAVFALGLTLAARTTSRGDLVPSGRHARAV
jgi:O-antigen/teichoic acid export membrane protein